MKNKKTLKRVVLLVLAFALVVTSTVFATLALYKSVYTSNSTLQAAAWNFTAKVGETSIQNFDLNTTIPNYENVADNKIAPDTAGNFTINVDGSGSEVAMDYKITIKITENLKSVPVTFTYNGTTVSAADMQKEDGGITIDDTWVLDAQTKTASYDISWAWVGSDDMQEDRINGVDNAFQTGTVKVQIIVTAVQQKPVIAQG